MGTAGSGAGELSAMGLRDDQAPALSDYAIIGDGLTCALVARDGGIDWLCYGRFDGPAVLCRLIDPVQGGYLHVAPRGRFATRRRYVGWSNVLVTVFEAASGTLRMTDCMPLAETGLSGPLVLRKLEGLAGQVEVELEFLPSFDFARAEARISLNQGGCEAEANGDRLRLSCPGALVRSPRGVTGTLQLSAGETRWVALTHGAAPPNDDQAERALRATVEAWERWSSHGRYSGPYADVLRRSALLLKLLIHKPTGGIVAAPTTSLPESPGGVRNWDYRFTWLRDASWLVSALMDLGYHDETMAFIDWLEALDLGAAKPPVFFDLDGKAPRREAELSHLRGYRDARPVRIGNAASNQDQHDVFGEVVATVHMCSEGMPSMRPLRPGLWKLVSALADRAASRWEQADHGMWEQRDPRQHYLVSKLHCWVAVDRALAIASRDGLSAPSHRWAGERARMREAILDGFDVGVRAFTRVLGEPDLDATALLLPRYDFLPATDPRMAETVQTVRRELGAGDGLVRRYLVSDGLPGVEGAFVACSFWLVDCLARQGRVGEAHELFQQVLARANDLGLLAEEVWPATGELLGNYPQAFSHLALIRAAVSVSQAEERARNTVHEEERPWE